jgi:predicted flap endonuclease-1-like 5' DNA nuclease
MIRGTPIFDGVALMEFSCTFYNLSNLPAEKPHLDAKAAFVQTRDVGERKAGATHGSTTCTRWSAATMKKLDELREAMEQDLAQRHFENAGATPAAGINLQDIGGIGENLADDDNTPQV